MKKEEFENSQEHGHMLFVGKNYHNHYYSFINENSELIFTIHTDKEKRDYLPYDYYHYLLIFFAIKATDEKNVGKQLQILADGRSDLMQSIETVKRDVKEHANCKAYDFEGFIKQIDALVEMGRAKLNSEILSKQNKINKYNIWLLAISIIVAVVSAYAAIKSANNDDDENLLKSQINITNKGQLLLKEKLLLQGNKIDSLEVILLKKKTP